MSKEIVVTLPYPDSKLSQNHRGAWQTTLKTKKEAYAVGYWRAKEALGGKTLQSKGEWTVSVEFAPPDKRKRDVHNAFAALKSYIDGIAAAIGVDDCMFVEWRILPFVYAKDSYAKLTFTPRRADSTSRRKSLPAYETKSAPNQSPRRGSYGPEWYLLHPGQSDRAGFDPQG